MYSQLLRSAAISWVFDDWGQELLQGLWDHVSQEEYEEAVLRVLRISEAAYDYLGDTVKYSPLQESVE